MTSADRLIKFYFCIVFLVFGNQTFAQSSCLTPEETQKAVASLDSPIKAVENKALRSELLEMKNARQKLEQKIIDNPTENQNLISAANELGRKNLLRLCEIIKQNGFVSKETVGEDGAAAVILLIKANQAFDLQRQIFPLVVAASNKELISKQDVAWLVDSIRASAQLPQIFGTQAKISGGLFYLYPLQNEAKVDEYRKLYQLPPLRDYIKFIQSQYQTIVLKSPPVQSTRTAKTNNPLTSETTAVAADPLTNLEESEIIKVESSLVSLNVRVISESANAAELPALQKNDFEVYEDGVKQEISFFSTNDAPFDLILLLDLSGSTADKQDLIRKSTRRFIETSRPTDRIAIVTFTDESKIVADLTGNRDDLLKSIKKIDDRGGSGVWGALQFVYENIIKTRKENRRSAIVIMTDGVDSSLLQHSFLPAVYPTFTELLESVRRSNTAIFPIYIDTESQSDSYEKKAYRTAQQTLKIIADESGGQTYYAKKLNDLNGIYEKIISDLGKVYSLGYEPSTELTSGTFHRLTVKLPNHPNLTIQAKQGFYAK